MLFAIAPFPRFGRQAGVFAKNLAEIPDISKPALFGHFLKRTRKVTQQLLCRLMALRLPGRPAKNQSAGLIPDQPQLSLHRQINYIRPYDKTIKMTPWTNFKI
ncbi:hypothetical protein WP7S18C02_02420 [Klebsiella sp. WP7-S18-CRE-02]|nr:hypothetical protein WP4W18E05_02180 [Klebsiella sp. WP4-W18-ESBL-05]BBS89627.1 hypothetical protein WP7S18C02_02420 [Klebsiella sp. WP7-S18-CRE-02]BBS94649.1 hypothetical protein WP7S18C03_02420 [Klebsiella sp. WP7-S18-CRE-03]BBS99679.1 hypothetical protein WP7S18E04_02420 [Klebsiella sp. WP7-S18-ESBL-04]